MKRKKTRRVKPLFIPTRDRESNAGKGLDPARLHLATNPMMQSYVDLLSTTNLSVFAVPAAYAIAFYSTPRAMLMSAGLENQSAPRSDFARLTAAIDKGEKLHLPRKDKWLSNEEVTHFSQRNIQSH